MDAVPKKSKLKLILTGINILSVEEFEG